MQKIKNNKLVGVLYKNIETHANNFIFCLCMYSHMHAVFFSLNMCFKLLYTCKLMELTLYPNLCN